MNASILTYMIFIGAIVIVIAPGLFALSYHLLHVMIGFSDQLSNVNNPNMPINFSADSINPESFKIFSTIAVLMIAFFSSLILSLIEKGDIKGGINIYQRSCYPQLYCIIYSWQYSEYFLEGWYKK